MKMLNILELSESIKNEGYSEEYAEAKLCQDIVLLLISKSKYANNVTIKGGVVMRSISNNIRRATLDIDFDFIKYSISDSSIERFVENLDGIMGIKLKVLGSPEELKHQDYEGKRIYLSIEDTFGNRLSSKIDIGVHKYYNISQEEYCFNMSFDSEGATLLINSKEQIFTEKLKSILKFGSLSTRYKDVYDIYYLAASVNKRVLLDTFKTLIFDDNRLKEENIKDIITRLKETFENKMYLRGLSSSSKNWVGQPNEIVLDAIINFISSLQDAIN